MQILPPVRRIVTGHDAAGKAVVIDDSMLESRSNPAGTSHLTLVWTSLGNPVDNDDATDGRSRTVDLTLPGGSVIRTVDMLPGTTAPMHRTSSLDYGIVISGAIELILDDGATTRCEVGDIVIQRGTIHAWRNPSAEAVARVAFVLIDAKPVTVDGAPLPDIHPRSAVTRVEAGRKGRGVTSASWTGASPMPRAIAPTSPASRGPNS